MNITRYGDAVGPIDPAIWNQPMSASDAARAAAIAASQGKIAADASAAADRANRAQQSAQAYAEAVNSAVAARLADGTVYTDDAVRQGPGMLGLAVAGVLAYLAFK